MFGVMNHLSVVICQDAQEAIDKGFDYKARKSTPVEISQVVIVKNGTVSGNSTVDLVLHDEAGNQYVVMVTGRLLKALPL